MFKRAERSRVFIKGAVTGPSGSGKTYSALLVASGMGRKIAVADTENGSASLYADKFQFDTMTIEPPYTTAKYLAAIKDAEEKGYDVLILDSISHAWAGDGGLLAQKESLDARGGNSYTNWGQITKEQERFKGALLNANIHILCTMRSKQDYILETNDKGKQAPKKVGLAPIQRDGMEYEFTFVLDLAMNHEAQASKDRTGLFDGHLFKPTAKTGETIMAWLAGAHPVLPFKQEGVSPAPPSPPKSEGGPTEKQIGRLFAIANKFGWTQEDVKFFLKTRYKIESTKDLTIANYEFLCNFIETSKPLVKI